MPKLNAMVQEDNDQLRDDEIIRLIKQGNSSRHFQLLYKRYYEKVLDKCFGLVRNRSTAEELAEDIFSKTFEKLATFQEKSSFSSWLYAITYNHCIDYLREKKKLHYPNWSAEHQIPEIIDDEEGQEKELNFERLEVILEEIHPEERAILLMKYREELSMKEIGNALRISEDAAKMRLKRARTRVKYLYYRKFMKHSNPLPGSRSAST
jgi:RNA polymerase sigma factor (sigma-70 family)